MTFFRKFLFILTSLSAFLFSSGSAAQTPSLQSPTGGNYTLTLTPEFSAFLNGFGPDRTFNVAISESPRSGINNQYTLFWVKHNVYGNQLLREYNNLLKWDNSWAQKTRNGNPDAPAVILSNSSPSSLTQGKTYYWHVVTSDGLYKSAEGSFIAGTPPPIHFCGISNLPQGYVVTSIDYRSIYCSSGQNRYLAERPVENLTICMVNSQVAYNPPAGFVYSAVEDNNYSCLEYGPFSNARDKGPAALLSTPHDGQEICIFSWPTPIAPTGYYISSTRYDNGYKCGGYSPYSRGNPIYTIRKLY